MSSVTKYPAAEGGGGSQKYFEKFPVPLGSYGEILRKSPLALQKVLKFPSPPWLLCQNFVKTPVFEFKISSKAKNYTCFYNYKEPLP